MTGIEYDEMKKRELLQEMMADSAGIKKTATRHWWRKSWQRNGLKSNYFLVVVGVVGHGEGYC